MCAEKERLLNLVRLANHELSSILDQAPRRAAEQPDKADELNRILASAKEAHKKAEAEYATHIRRHGCSAAADAQMLADCT
jgi:hypothetical protein